jgi:uncharacterized protein YaaN involved in tellurite resistance
MTEANSQLDNITKTVPAPLNTVQMEAELSKDLAPTNLTPEDKSRVEKLKNDIKLNDMQVVIQFGVGIQKNISSFADSVLNQVKNKDTGEVGNLLTNLMQSIRSMDVEGLTEGNKGFLGKLFSTITDRAQRFVAKYEKIGSQIEDLSDKLDRARMQLIRDVVMLDNLFEKNLGYFKDLNLHILAGEMKIEEARQTTIPELEAKAKSSGDMLDVQKSNDFKELVNRFDKKIHDLKLSRAVTLQTIPQIRIVQNNDQELVTKIQSSILNTIPLWKNQIVIGISLFRQQVASKLQKKVSDTTNELLKKNAELLKQNSVEVAKESERGIVDIETLRQTNASLISTIEETIAIQEAGRQKREEVEKELVAIENQLRDKLVSIRN